MNASGTLACAREEGTLPATNKVGTQLLVSPHIKQRAQALAVVRQESVAEVYRVALEGGGLPALERAHAGALQELAAALEHMKVNRGEALDIMLSSKIRLDDLFEEDQPGGARQPRDRFPAGVR